MRKVKNMGKTHRRERATRKSNKPSWEIKNPMVRPVQAINVAGSPSMRSERDRTRTGIRMGATPQQQSEHTAARPIEEITLNNVQSDQELKLALNAINRSAKKIADAQKTKKYSTWTTADEDYTLPIDQSKQTAVIEDDDNENEQDAADKIKNQLESTSASNWKDFPTKGMPVPSESTAGPSSGAAGSSKGIHKDVQRMSLKKGDSFNRTPSNSAQSQSMQRNSALSGYSTEKTKQRNAADLLPTPAHLKHDKKQYGAFTPKTKGNNIRAPLKKSVGMADNSFDSTTKPGSNKLQPAYKSKEVVGYSKVNPKTNSRATYFTIANSGISKDQPDKCTGAVKKCPKALEATPASKAKFAAANLARIATLAPKSLELTESATGALRVQRRRHTDVVNNVFKSKNSSKNDPFLKRVHHKVNNRTAMNEYAKEPKYSSTYKQPSIEDYDE
ncbi:hypothetical protein NEPAR06_0034 [Nematocida parisii]|nr:hypothetical protein NEPAR07_0250 [Nematocida parisii]KAI5152913.1 hypothetical protein NEPAR06_0034 [Nematocida parisii]KAI5157436.1 hypothetical protein NEPAR05_1275 [Nematocida parisii]